MNIKRRLLSPALLAAAMIPQIAAATPVSAHELNIILNNSGMLNRARQLMVEGNVPEARKIYEEALQRDLEDNERAKVHNGLCVSYIMDEQWGLALEQCNAAINLVPNNWRFYNNRGNIFLQTGDLDRAKAEYARAIRMSPQSYVPKRNMEIAELWIANGTGNRPATTEPT